MTSKDAAAARTREFMEKEEAKTKTVTLTRRALAHALETAADVMQNSAAVAKSIAWQEHYRQAMNDYRNAANMVASGAKFTIKG